MGDIKSPFLAEFDRMYEDANYSAQTYFEAAKSAEFWGKYLVFAPAVASAIASLLVAIGAAKQWGALGAVAGAVAATSSFLGSDRKAKSLRDAGNSFTALRHAIRLERISSSGKAEEEIETAVRELRARYNSIVAGNELVANRFFERASERISKGVLDYTVDESKENSVTTSGKPAISSNSTSP